MDVDSTTSSPTAKTTTTTTTTSHAGSPPPLPPPPSESDVTTTTTTAEDVNEDALDPTVRRLNLQNSRQSGSPLIFSPPPPPPQSAIDELDAFIKEHSIVNNGIIIEENNVGHVVGNGLILSPNDKQILGFYATQV